MKYYDDAVLFEKAGTRGEPFDIAAGGWGLDYADRAACSSSS